MTLKMRAVLWDMDGTLIDTEQLHFEIVRDWCARHGYTLTSEGNERILGRSMPEKWEILKPHLDGSADVKDFYDECARDYMSRLSSDMMRKEPVSVVRRLAEMGVPQACVSNGDENVIEANLRAIGLEDCISFFISGSMVSRGKPYPDPYLAAAERLDIRPQLCIAVEDSPVGISAAMAAGCYTCAWPGEEGGALSRYSRLISSADDFPWEMLQD